MNVVATVRIKEHPRDLTAEEIRDLVGEWPLMLEIGSHEGIDTEKFLAAMPGITLHCFEPEQRAIARFKARIGDNAQVWLNEEAVADVDGEKLFWASTGKAGHMDDWDYSGSLHEPSGHMKRSPEIQFKEPIAVPCIRLDSWFGDEEDLVVDFIWADVQGSQRDVIAGGQATLAQTRYLYMECHHPFPLYEGEPSREELIALLPGFEPIGIYGNDNILFKNRLLT